MNNSPKDMFAAAYSIVRSVEGDTTRRLIHACELWMARNSSSLSEFSPYVLAALSCRDRAFDKDEYPISKFRLQLRHDPENAYNEIPF